MSDRVNAELGPEFRAGVGISKAPNDHSIESYPKNYNNNNNMIPNLQLDK